MAPFKKSGGFKGGNDRPGGFRSGGDRPQFARKGNFSRGRDDRGGNGGGFGNRDERPVQLYKATCAECGKTCEVPFRPNGEKPVFCRDCFALKRGTDERSERPDRREVQSRDFTPRDYDKPAAPAPRPQSDPRMDGLVRQLDLAMKKLDTLTQMVEGLALAAPAPAPKKEESLSKVVKKVAKKAVAKKPAKK
jgi:CxxC-x17-CxxC domain-containing protein